MRGKRWQNCIEPMFFSDSIVKSEDLREEDEEERTEMIRKISIFLELCFLESKNLRKRV